MTTNFVSTNMLECQILGSFAVFKKYPNEQTLDIIKDLTSIKRECSLKIYQHFSRVFWSVNFTPESTLSAKYH